MPNQIDAESYLNELVGRTAALWQMGDSARQFVNVLSLNSIGLLVQDAEHEYFVSWASVRHIRQATSDEIAEIGSPLSRVRRRRDVMH